MKIPPDPETDAVMLQASQLMIWLVTRPDGRSRCIVDVPTADSGLDPGYIAGFTIQVSCSNARGG
jgi:hypothetical protein